MLSVSIGTAIVVLAVHLCGQAWTFRFTAEDVPNNALPTGPIPHLPGGRRIR